MNSLILENFRCFAGRHEVPLRPLTLLVGENSTGKTSFLAAARLAGKMRSRISLLDFNEEPYSLGSFDEITTNTGGKSGRSPHFGLGSAFDNKVQYFPRKWSGEIRFSASFADVRGRPGLNGFRLSAGEYEIVLNSDGRLIVRTPSMPKGHSFSKSDVKHNPTVKLEILLQALRQAVLPNEIPENERLALWGIGMTWFSGSEMSPYACAPNRAQPKRTYELLSEAPRPQGDHVPMLLAQTYGQEEWEKLRDPLVRFSRASRLFDDIIVKRLGRSEGSPFQIHVKLGGAIRNLIDVGYGVSQILPLVVDILRDKKPRLYLIQQPEVHLHPRAQAELATLLSTFVRTRSKQLLIETHSDYIIDRIRMEVREKRLRPSDAIILYFERYKSEVKIHPIAIDEEGNLVDTPPSYRSFFLDEEARFLGMADVRDR